MDAKFEFFDSLRQDYSIDDNLYREVRYNLEYQYRHDQTEVNEFLQMLPTRLKLKLQMIIYEARFKSIKWFKNKSMHYTVWVSNLLKPTVKGAADFIYHEDDEVHCVYFLLAGDVQYVLERYANACYLKVDIGEMFGVIDVFASVVFEGKDVNDWYSNKASLCRHNSLLAQSDSELLSLTIGDLHMMSKQFPSYYKQLVDLAYLRMRMILKLKLKAFKQLAMHEDKFAAFDSMSQHPPSFGLQACTLKEVDEMILEELSSESEEESDDTLDPIAAVKDMNTAKKILKNSNDLAEAAKQEYKKACSLPQIRGKAISNADVYDN